MVLNQFPFILFSYLFCFIFVVFKNTITSIASNSQPCSVLIAFMLLFYCQPPLFFLFRLLCFHFHFVLLLLYTLYRLFTMATHVEATSNQGLLRYRIKAISGNASFKNIVKIITQFHASQKKEGKQGKIYVHSLDNVKKMWVNLAGNQQLCFCGNT